MAIKASALIIKFQFAYDNKWGYIYGEWHTAWTQAKQTALVNSFVKKYGSNWKNDEAAKKANKYYGALYGSKWVGHIVTDCSGLFYWAFKELGGYMYHGSNTMWDKYCTAKGELT
jgi:cell wall-associated NlpC family hydrolase